MEKKLYGLVISFKFSVVAFFHLYLRRWCADFDSVLIIKILLTLFTQGMRFGFFLSSLYIDGFRVAEVNVGAASSFWLFFFPSTINRFKEWPRLYWWLLVILHIKYLINFITGMCTQLNDCTHCFSGKWNQTLFSLL